MHNRTTLRSRQSITDQTQDHATPFTSSGSSRTMLDAASSLASSSSPITRRIVTADNTRVGHLSSSSPSSMTTVHTTNGNNHNNISRQNNSTRDNILVSPKEKADVNAKLEHRRRQRREQRLRREAAARGGGQQQPRHHPYATGSAVVDCLAVWCQPVLGGHRHRSGWRLHHLVVVLSCCGLICFGWMVGFYFIALDLGYVTTLPSVEQHSGGVASPLQLLQQARKNERKFLRNMKDATASKLESTSSKLKLLAQTAIEKVRVPVRKDDTDLTATTTGRIRTKHKHKPKKKEPILSYTGGSQQFEEVLQVDNTIDNMDGDTVPLVGDPTTVVDMRQLNYELPFLDEDGGAWKQGWDLQPNPDDTNDPEQPLKIIVIPHSHCDPGWIKTYDDYFQSQVKQILSSIYAALMKNPARTFIWAEMSYFEWWWNEQPSVVQNNVRHLVRNKQFEFVTGGWVQPDEANTQLYAMEIQLEEGHDFIRREFGSKYLPKYGWSIDPFGYSPTMAYLLKKHNFKAMVIQRVHYAIKKELALHQNLEFMWRQTWEEDTTSDSRTNHDIFTHVMPFFSYDTPHTCGPDPAVCCQFDFARLPKYATGDGSEWHANSCPWKKFTKRISDTNLKDRSLLLLDQYRKKANLYRTNTVLIPLGDDFRYQTVPEADEQFTNYSKMMDYINANVKNVEIQFGTLSDYFQTIMNEPKRRFNPPLLKGSFFTYSDVRQDYWSGYFTSRIFDKALDRQLERVLYAATSLGASKEEMQNPRRALSLFQHHDGVTGTAKNIVVEDYAKRIHTAIRETQNWIVTHLILERSKHLAKQLKLQPCWQSTAPRGLSQNLCDHSSDTDQILVYNPLETNQSCGPVIIPGRTVAHAKLPCEVPGSITNSLSNIQYDPNTGLMISPIREEWMVWKVKEGGAYLFVPGRLGSYSEHDVTIENGGAIVSTKNWKRTVVERYVDPMMISEEEKDKQPTVVVDFIYETNLQTNNEEWLARFTSSEINNEGIFHTDLNGYNFDTHHFRSDMPLQSQVFPMPTLAAIEEHSNNSSNKRRKRMTILSEHAQGTASIEESTIDVWLDRRLAQDDERGLAQGVMDNVPTRTRLRIVLESIENTKPAPLSFISATKTPEFEITPFCKLQWKELNHPLEMFGSGSGGTTTTGITTGGAENKAGFTGLFKNSVAGVAGLMHNNQRPTLPGLEALQLDNRPLKERVASSSKKVYKPDDKEQHTHLIGRAGDTDGKLYNIGVVYMVYNRVDYFKQAIDTLRKSDYPKSLPVIISHDGHVKEMVDFVESIKSEFKILQLFHPYSCYEHPNTFPGNDPKLNENYNGDTFGNKRDSKITCCKHHFTWLINTVFNMDETKNIEGFLFMEEDYIVAPTVFETIQKGYSYIDAKERRHEFFGLELDPSHGYAFKFPVADWIESRFITVRTSL